MEQTFSVISYYKRIQVHEIYMQSKLERVSQYGLQCDRFVFH